MFLMKAIFYINILLANVWASDTNGTIVEYVIDSDILTAEEIDDSVTFTEWLRGFRSGASYQRGASVTVTTTSESLDEFENSVDEEIGKKEVIETGPAAELIANSKRSQNPNYRIAFEQRARMADRREIDADWVLCDREVEACLPDRESRGRLLVMGVALVVMIIAILELAKSL
jgi:hypothetical protein